ARSQPTPRAGAVSDRRSERGGTPHVLATQEPSVAYTTGSPLRSILLLPRSPQSEPERTAPAETARPQRPGPPPTPPPPPPPPPLPRQGAGPRSRLGPRRSR